MFHDMFQDMTCFNDEISQPAFSISVFNYHSANFLDRYLIDSL